MTFPLNAQLASLNSSTNQQEELSQHDATGLNDNNNINGNNDGYQALSV
jgi:hypothetical protein